MTVPIFLSEFVRTILIMSITGGAITLVLLFLKPLVRLRLPKNAQYIFWIMALFAFLVPFSRIVSIPDTAINAPSIHAVVERTVVSVNENASRHRPTFPLVQHSPILTPTPLPSAFFIHDTIPQPTPSIEIISVLMLVYPWVAAAVMLFHIIGYLLFIRKLRKTVADAWLEETAMLQELAQDKKVRLFVSELATTPMLIGFIKPTIVLPNREYTSAQLHSIYHETPLSRRYTKPTFTNSVKVAFYVFGYDLAGNCRTFRCPTKFL